MCQALGVTRSGYYAWKRRPPSSSSKTDAQLAVKVTAAHPRNRGVCGSSRRIHRELRAQRVRMGKKRVERLMRENGRQIAENGTRVGSFIVRDVLALRFQQFVAAVLLLGCGASRHAHIHTIALGNRDAPNTGKLHASIATKNSLPVRRRRSLAPGFAYR